jgi:hypothetical protein
MMREREAAYIFHLYRKGAQSLILHPFDTGERLLAALDGGEVVGRYGAEPRVEALTELRTELHRLADQGVSRWVAERRFVPKFLLAAGAFLVVYFFFSFAVRNPLPVIDEAAAGIGAAVGLFAVLGRADLRSRLAEQKRIEARAAVDRVTFLESAFVSSVEEALAEGESGSLIEWVEGMTESAGWVGLGDQNADEARSFVRTVESRFRLRRGKRDARSLRRLLHKRHRSQEGLARWARARKIDVPLYAVYRRIKRSVVAGSPSVRR